MTKQIPRRLGIEPLIECVMEFRFSSDITSVSSILPGLIFEAYSNRVTKTITLPAASIPPQLREADQNLRYAPVVQISLDPGPYIILLGDHVAALTCPRPYRGWGEFEIVINEFAERLEKTNLITHPERFSMKYVDILSTLDRPSIEALNVEVKLGGHSLTSEPITLRTETNEGPFVHIIQIITSVNAKLLDNTQINGVLIENDTIYNHASGEFWTEFKSHLSPMHDLNKRRFFQLLREETLTKLEPEY